MYIGEEVHGMNKTTNFGLVFLLILLAGILCLLLYPVTQGTEEPMREINSSCDYFNGEIVEITQDCIFVKPTEEWQWQDVACVKIPKMQLRLDDRGEEYATEMQTQVFKSDISTLEIGDQIRVAFNSQSFEWEDDAVLIKVVFMILKLSL